jgi:hypothetical protein
MKCDTMRAESKQTDAMRDELRGDAAEAQKYDWSRGERRSMMTSIRGFNF